MKFWYLSLLSAFCQSENIFKKVIAVFKKEVNFQSEFSLYVDPQFETEIIKEQPPLVGPTITIKPRNPTVEEIEESQSVCESRPLDIAILIDSSRSIYKPDFEKAKQSVVRLIQDLYPIDSENTQVSILQYGTKARVIHRFTDEQSLTALTSTVTQMSHTLEDHTYVADPIRLCINQIFPKARASSQKAKRVIIILTDGEFQDQAKALRFAQHARNSKVEIFAVGIGLASRKNNLDEMTGSSQNVYFQENFGDLLKFIQTLKVVQFNCVKTPFYRDYCHEKTAESYCSQICLNVPEEGGYEGGFECACKTNFFLGKDGRTCVTNENFNGNEDHNQNLDRNNAGNYNHSEKKNHSGIQNHDGNRSPDENQNVYQDYKPDKNLDDDRKNQNQNELCDQFCQDGGILDSDRILIPSNEEPFHRKIFTIDFGNDIIRDAQQLVQKHHKSFFGLIVILIILGLILFGGLIIYKKRKNRDYTQSEGVRNQSLKKILHRRWT